MPCLNLIVELFLDPQALFEYPELLIELLINAPLIHFVFFNYLTIFFLFFKL